MSSTRHASPDRPIAHERYMSDPLYVERRAIAGRAVAEKAATVKDAALRKVILFLQGLTVESGGIRPVEDWIMENASRWLGSPMMRHLGAAGIYSADEVRKVRRELGLSRICGLFLLKGEGDVEKPLLSDFSYDSLRYHRQMERWKEAQAEAEKLPAAYPAQEFAAFCMSCARREIGKFLNELCLNPLVTFDRNGRDEAYGAELVGWNAFPWLDIKSALLELMEIYSNRAAAGTVETSITRKVWQAIERAREVHRSSGPVPQHIVIVQGIEGVGKTSAAKAKCGRHLGEMRFVPLLGNVNLKDFFRSASRACGLPCGENLKAEQMKTNVENFLRLTRMILVIDEAHRLFPDGNRVYAAPTLMNWIYTLAELKVPVVMLVTPQFATRMDIVENCTDWRSGQLKRRVRLYEVLPGKLTPRDLEAIAESRFPRAAAGIIDEVVGYAGSTRYPLDAIHIIAEDAYRIALESGRERPVFADVDRAINECARPTYAALTTQRDREMLSGSKSRRGGKGRAAAEPLPANGSEAAAVLPPTGRATAAALGGGDTLHAGEPTKNRLRGFDLAGA